MGFWAPQLHTKVQVSISNQRRLSAGAEGKGEEEKGLRGERAENISFVIDQRGPARADRADRYSRLDLRGLVAPPRSK